MLPKSKQRAGASGPSKDWSTTGTFLRKPTGGWLHEDNEFQSGLSINYTVQYMGSVIVTTSMRTLQFNTRILATKEAILRLAEQSGNTSMGKRKKVTKQVDRMLGGMDVRWAGEVNLSVSVENLTISDEVGGMVILNHSLPSISFASGGDGVTSDYIGYVAKDPIHGREKIKHNRLQDARLVTAWQLWELSVGGWQLQACHVFECSLSSQFVLATIGQAFEIRYKMYLNGSTAQPALQRSEDTWDNHHRIVSGGGGTVQTIADVHTLETSPTSNGPTGIYSDVQERPPIPRQGNGHAQPVVEGNMGPPRLGNPYDTMEDSMAVASAGTVPPNKSVDYSDTYEEIDDKVVTVVPRKKRAQEDTSVQEYVDTFISIRQSTISDCLDQINLIPALPHHDYTNVNFPEEEENVSNGSSKPSVKHKPSRPLPFRPKPAIPGSTPVSNGSNSSPHPPLPPLPLLPPIPPALQNNHQSPKLSRRGEGRVAASPSVMPKPPARSTVGPSELSKGPSRLGGSPSDSPKPPGRSGGSPSDSPKPPGRSGGSPSDSPKTPRRSGGSPSDSPKPPRRSGGSPVDSPKPPARYSYDAPYQLKTKPVPPTKKKPTIVLSKTKPGTYDDLDEVLAYKKDKPKKPSREGIMVAKSMDDQGRESPDYDIPGEGMYNTAEAVYDDRGFNIAEIGSSPKFDDGIYMSSGGGGGDGLPGGIGSNRVSRTTTHTNPIPENPIPEVLRPLSQQKYYHGPLCRIEAEGLLISDGDFLVRESSKKPGQYVLTGMADSKAQHLLLMDKHGKVKSKDREFDSVSQLIQYFTESRLPLVIGNSQVFLKRPVVNVFLAT